MARNLLDLLGMLRQDDPVRSRKERFSTRTPSDMSFEELRAQTPPPVFSPSPVETPVPYPLVREDIRARQEAAPQRGFNVDPSGEPYSWYDPRAYISDLFGQGKETAISSGGGAGGRPPAGFVQPSLGDVGKIALETLIGKRDPLSPTADVSQVTEHKISQLTEDIKGKIRAKEFELSLSGEKLSEGDRQKIEDTAKREFKDRHGFEPTGEPSSFIPSEAPISVSTPEVPAPKDSAETEPPEKTNVDETSTNLPGQDDPGYTTLQKKAKAANLSVWDYVVRESAAQTGASKSDINEQITQLSRRLLETLDRKPGWPELLMAFGLTLMGQDGVGFVQQINQARLGQVSALQRALQGAEGERGRREALGASYQQAQMTRATALQKEQFGRREKTLSNLIAATGRTSAEFSKYLREHSDLGGTKLKKLLGYPGTAKERMDLTHIRKMAEMAQTLLTEYPAWATTLSLSQLLEAAKAKLEEQPIAVTG